MRHLRPLTTPKPRTHATHRRRTSVVGAPALLAVSATALLAAACGSTPAAVKQTKAAPKLTAASSPKPSKAPQPPAAPRGNGTWRSPVLVITPQSLGAVRVGMTTAQAQTAAGVTLDDVGDGFNHAVHLPTGSADLWAGEGGTTQANTVVYCVAAYGLDSKQVVETPEGFKVGESVQQLKAIYGSRAVWVPDPGPFGMTPQAGFEVAEDGGHLVFWQDDSGEYITGIAGGNDTLTPSDCTG
jgi:hypothetical protein